MHGILLLLQIMWQLISDKTRIREKKLLLDFFFILWYSKIIVAKTVQACSDYESVLTGVMQ